MSREGARGGPRIGVLSLEPWDDVWRRNQHLAARLVGSGAVDSLVFIGPPAGGLALQARRYSPMPGIEAVIPPLLVPRKYGGHRVLRRWLRRELAGVDRLWINDPVAGAGVLTSDRPAMYDVTDDWRSMAQSSAERARIVAAEDTLATSATTVVCSEVLAQRWRTRYGVDPTVVRNGVDVIAMRNAAPHTLDGIGPHAVYVGTLHASRLDVELVEALAAQWPGTIHLVGPDSLDDSARARLLSVGVRIPGAITSTEVPSWLISADVLICPHIVDEFTLSLDAIKAHEYLATDRPIVATATSGFQSITAPGLTIASTAEFTAVALDTCANGPFSREIALDWTDRAADFATALFAEGPFSEGRTNMKLALD